MVLCVEVAMAKVKSLEKVPVSVGARSWERFKAWADAPLDVLILVFVKLGPEDLVNCLHVNTNWRDAVNYVGMHYGKWQEMAQAAMVNEGMPLRRRSLLGWRDLYINYCLWRRVRDAKLTWHYEIKGQDMKYMHVYKDILIVEQALAFEKKYFHIHERLQETTKNLTALEKDTGKGSSLDTDRMLEMLVQETPFKRLVVIDEGCYYILHEKNILRYMKWDNRSKQWISSVLGRYYGCNRSISDISVHNDEVFILLKTGLVFRLNRDGRNFVPDRRFERLTPAQHEFSRMIYGQLATNLEKIDVLNIPEYSTGKHVMFRNQQSINVVVAVPWEKEFKMLVEERNGNVVLEYPGLSCAMQHGQLMFLGFKNGKIEIVMSKNVVKNGGAPEISINVQDSKYYKGEDPTIVALEVYEVKNSHHLFVATKCHIYRLVITYPEYIKKALGLDVEFRVED